jgi:erythronate-4-phosphate dehydrogenase
MKIVADENIPFVKESFSSIGDVQTIDGRAISASTVKDADILLVRSITRVDEELLTGSRIKFVATATIGFEHIDTEFLAKNNIGFASAPGSNANSVAEYVVAALLEVAKGLGITLDGKSIGIIGVGNVGNRVEKKCRALGINPFLNDPPLFRKTGDRKYLPLKDLFDCDIITLHTPLTFEGVDKTYYLADKKFFNSVKKGCIFINTARGPVADSQVLKDAIKGGSIKAAVLDVWENEPNIDIELLEMVDIGTAHIAGYSLDGKIAGLIMIYKAACDYFGLKPAKDMCDFLPEPAVPVIEIDGDNDEQGKLRQIVSKIYDIRSDDSALRNMLKMPTDKRAVYFDRLRKEYPVRREFQNTICFLATDNIKGTEKKLEEKLKGIGFRVSEETNRKRRCT